jgi:hypothetical protein
VKVNDVTPLMMKKQVPRRSDKEGQMSHALVTQNRQAMDGHTIHILLNRQVGLMTSCESRNLDPLFG